MFWHTKKFNKEIAALGLLKRKPGELNPLAQEQVKQKIFQEIREESLPSARKPILHRSRFAPVKFAIATLGGLAVVTGTAFASAAANPGDLLYPVKLAQEKVRLQLAASEESKAQLQADFARERIKEIKHLSTSPNLPASKSPVLPSAPLASSTPQSTNTPQSLEKNNKKDGNPNLKNNNDTIQQNAKAEITNTIKELQATEDHLQKQGKAKEAEKVRENVTKIKSEAKEQHLLDEQDN